MLKRFYENIKKSVNEIRDEFFDRMPAPQFQRLLIPEDYLLNHDERVEVSELDTIVAHDVKLNITFLLVKFHEGPQSYYSWRKSNISGFFILSENRFDSIDEAIRAMAAEEWECNFYRVV